MSDNGGTELSKEQKLALFEAYELATAEVTAAKAKAEEASKALAACGHGPFKWKGQTFTVVKAKGSDGFTLRRHGSVEVEEIG